jgi:Obg family GTPase CgtA-like protein
MRQYYAPCPSLTRLLSSSERRVKVLVPSYNKGPPIDVFNIEEDPHTRTWMVMGDGLERFTQMTNWESYEAVKRFQKVLDVSGVNQELKRRGVRKGDTVVLGEVSHFVFLTLPLFSLSVCVPSEWQIVVKKSRTWAPGRGGQQSKLGWYRSARGGM